MKKNFQFFTSVFVSVALALSVISCEPNSEPEPQKVVLGDLGQDLLIYGNKLYISMSNSSYVGVLDIENHAKGVFILNQGGNKQNNASLMFYDVAKDEISNVSVQNMKMIRLFNGETPRTPRYLAAHEGKIYVSCWDGTVARIDAAGLTLEESSTSVGKHPEGLAVANGKLYIANASYMAETDSSLSVINLSDFYAKNSTKMTVGENPNIVKADGRSSVYVSYQGNFQLIPGGFKRVNTTTNQVTGLADAPTTDFALFGDYVYFYNITYDASYNPTLSFGRYNVSQSTIGVLEPIISDNVTIQSPYGIAVDSDGKLYIADAVDYSNPGKIYIFDAAGKKIVEHTVGVNPCKFAFY
ncbi:MAG: hypothetical protein LBG77_04255 [Dysgonamonadaceae bacterium]|jgi:DNA-binding beta-propeller fold protein YncE|nr:hypothetical protein [Dysgonamonadaceae bacterium]